MSSTTAATTTTTTITRPPRAEPTGAGIGASIDYLGLANHVFVFCQLCYIAGNFFRSRIGSALAIEVSDAFLNSYFFFLALLYFVDAILYYCCVFDTCCTRTGIGPVLEDGAASSGNSDSMTESELTEDDDVAVSSEFEPGSVISTHSNTADFRLSTIGEESQSLFPLTLDGVGELLNILASIVCVGSGVIPFAEMVAPRSEGEQWVKRQIVVDFTSMLIWTIDAFVYAIAWARYEKQRGVTFRRFAWIRDPYLWANFLNIAASLLYLVSTSYTFTLLHMAYLWHHDRDRQEIQDYRAIQREQRTLAFGGDIIYLVCALTMELAWFRDKKRELLASRRESSTQTLEQGRVHEDHSVADHSIERDHLAKSMLEEGLVASSSVPDLHRAAAHDPETLVDSQSVEHSALNPLLPYRPLSSSLPRDLGSPLLRDERARARQLRRERRARMVAVIQRGTHRYHSPHRAELSPSPITAANATANSHSQSRPPEPFAFP